MTAIPLVESGMQDWKKDLDSLIELISNVVDAFSAAFFALDTSKKNWIYFLFIL